MVSLCHFLKTSMFPFFAVLQHDRVSGVVLIHAYSGGGREVDVLEGG